MSNNTKEGSSRTQGPVWPEAGTVVSIPIALFYKHKGIVSDRWNGGKPMIISNSARSGGVHEEFWDVFAEGGTVMVDGYLGGLPNFEVLSRAKSLISSQYDLLRWNCEHFVAYAHGLKPTSPQVAVTVAIATLCIGVLAAAR
jgi:hypothetical protein